MRQRNKLSVDVMYWASVEGNHTQNIKRLTISNYPPFVCDCVSMISHCLSVIRFVCSVFINFFFAILSYAEEGLKKGAETFVNYLFSIAIYVFLIR